MSLTLIVINLILVAWNVLSFSTLIPILLKTSDIGFAGGITLGVVNIVIVVYTNYHILITKTREKKGQKVFVKDNVDESRKRIIEKLKELDNISEFKDDLKEVLRQTDRVDSKRDKIMLILDKKFKKGELSYSKFSAVILGVYELFLNNTSTIVTKVEAFDLKEYRYLQEQINKGKTDKIIYKKQDIFRDYFESIKDTIVENEEIILKLDNLLLELSNIIDDDIDLDQSLELKELEKLIKNTNLYQ